MRAVDIEVTKLPGVTTIVAHIPTGVHVAHSDGGSHEENRTTAMKQLRKDVERLHKIKLEGVGL